MLMYNIVLSKFLIFLFQMSGEGSSRQVGRKRRNTHQQQESEEELEAPVANRKITYIGEGIPHGQSDRLEDSPLLQFDIESDEGKKLSTLIDVDLLPFKRIDWTLVRQLGQKDRIEQLLGPKFKKILDCSASQYKEITLEFHSTFQYKIGKFAEPDAVSFCLGRTFYQMSVPEFAVATKFYTDSEVESAEFITSWRGIFKKRVDYGVQKEELQRFWKTISISPYSQNMVISDIIDPVHRFICKILAFTLIGRGQGDNKINHLTLFCLMCMVESRPINLATVFAMSMKRVARGGPGAKVCCGPYVTWLAQKLKVFTPYPKKYMTEGPTPRFMNLRDLQAARIVTYTDPPQWVPPRQGPQVQPPPDTEATEEMLHAIPTRYQVPLLRQEIPAQYYPLREPQVRPPRPDHITLESLYERMDSGFGSIMATQRGLEEGMAHIMHNMSLGYPRTPYWQHYHQTQAGPSDTDGTQPSQPFQGQHGYRPGSSNDEEE